MQRKCFKMYGIKTYHVSVAYEQTEGQADRITIIHTFATMSDGEKPSKSSEKVTL